MSKSKNIEDFTDAELVEVFGLKLEKVQEESKGGQTCGMYSRGFRLTSEELKYSHEVWDVRSQHKARNWLMTVFRLYLEERL